MGLPNSGKTWLANRLGKELSVPTWDADVVRKIYNDWDFSIQGRAVQADRMRTLAELDQVSISAFICPPDVFLQSTFWVFLILCFEFTHLGFCFIRSYKKQ